MENNEDDVVIEGEVVESSWFISAINGNLDEIKKNGETSAGRQDDNGCSALMYCANLGHIDCVKYIATNFKKELRLKDKNGNTALMYASMNGQLEAIKILAKYEQGMANLDGKTALDLATENNYIECVKFLKDIEGTNNQNDESGRDHKKDLMRYEQANKEMQALLERQKARREQQQKGTGAGMGF